METKKCPYCGGEIMKAAKKCKHCGEWLEECTQPAGQNSGGDYSNNKVEITHSTTKKIVLIVAAVLVLVFVIWLIVASNQKSDWERAMEEYNSSSYHEESIYEDVPVEVLEEEEYPYGYYDYESDYSNSSTDAYNPNGSADSWY